MSADGPDDKVSMHALPHLLTAAADKVRAAMDAALGECALDVPSLTAVTPN